MLSELITTLRDDEQINIVRDGDHTVFNFSRIIDGFRFGLAMRVDDAMSPHLIEMGIRKCLDSLRRHVPNKTPIGAR